ncbi:MAG TPA: CYCXC family (seleno)protein [Pyrinomonadaceae bacterium]|nr:CYCXC family (seleno)protein [Pyrinomonadaceae bacterium]
MRRNCFLLGAAVLALVVVGCNSPAPQETAKNERPGPAVAQSTAAPAKPQLDEHGHDHSVARVPAFQVDELSLKTLGPTLAPEKFVGKTREAYKAVKAIPRTIAQLPCYCECDVGFGHKSLYSCYEDDHAAHCAVCVDEVLLAYRLEKEEKLTPEQIRERIIAQYSAAH